MKTTPCTYVLTLNSPAGKGPRLWRGKSIHALRHCAVKQMVPALREIQRKLETLHASSLSTSASQA